MDVKSFLLGIIRLSDSPRVMKRLQESDRPKKEKKEVAPAQPAAQKPVAQPKRTNAPPAATRQMSEDEIDRIKRQNKGSTSTTTAPAPAATPAAEPERPVADRVAALKSRTTSNVTSEDSDNSSATSPVRRTPPHTEVSFDDD